MGEPVLPIGVVIPTLNAMEFLPAHLCVAEGWADKVSEIVVVDGFSEDGSFDFLKQRLRHAPVRFFQRPRGLYQAWNFGVSQLGTKYTYISTAGDTIDAAGLTDLFTTAEDSDADAVLSPPEFISPTGTPVSANRWPIHDLASAEAITRPQTLSALHVFFISVLNLPQGIMGSSAGNLDTPATPVGGSGKRLKLPSRSSRSSSQDSFCMKRPELT